MARARDEVIVDHAAGLHESVAYRCTYKFETVGEESLTHGIALELARRDFAHGVAVIVQRTSAYEGPNETIKTARLMVQRKIGTGVTNRSGDFESVAYNTGIGE